VDDVQPAAASLEDAAWERELPPLAKLVYVAMARVADRARTGQPVRMIDDVRQMTGLDDETLQQEATRLAADGHLEFGPCSHYPDPAQPPGPSHAGLRLVARDGRRVQ
jgi:hypothetical protein